MSILPPASTLLYLNRRCNAENVHMAWDGVNPHLPHDQSRSAAHLEVVDRWHEQLVTSTFTVQRSRLDASLGKDVI